MLVIVLDESGSDNMYGGGQVAWVVASAKVKPGYRSIRMYQHQSTLLLTVRALGITAYPGAGGRHGGVLLALVRPEGLEPPRVAPQDPKSCASTSSATVAGYCAST
jgi:hypothetical protein